MDHFSASLRPTARPRNWRPRLVAWVVVGTGVAELLADLRHIDTPGLHSYGYDTAMCQCQTMFFGKNKYYIS